MSSDDQKPSTTKNEEFDPSKINDHVKKLSHKLPTGHQPYKVVAGEKDKTETFYKAQLKPKELLFLKNCTDCTYIVGTVCTKVLIEDCKNVTVTLKDKIMTNVIELWKCDNVTVNIDTDVFTVQLDICNDVKLIFDKKDHYHQVVWAGVNNLAIEFLKHPEHNMVTGLAQMRDAHSHLTVNDQIDQFIIRFLSDGKLTPEMIVRLANGYPTTDREADEWDAQQARKEQITEEQVRKMIDLAPQLGIHGIGKKGADGKKIKIGRNDPCSCGSGMKYKKCCESKTTGEKIAKSLATPAGGNSIPAPKGTSTTEPSATSSNSTPNA